MRTVAYVALVTGALASACAGPAAPPEPAAGESSGPPPLPRGHARVDGVRALGPYIEAHLAGNAGRQGFLFPASAACRDALVDGLVVRIAPVPPLARVVTKAGVRCDARGLANLAAWRDSLPERRSSFLIPTEPAELHLVSEAPGALIAAGKLPLALELRWPRPLDVAAVLPDTPACRAHLARERTEMEFRARGEDVLVLRGRLEPCPVLAIADPIFL
jgi:hypothetical protein